MSSQDELRYTGLIFAKATRGGGGSNLGSHGHNWQSSTTTTRRRRRRRRQMCSPRLCDFVTGNNTFFVISLHIFIIFRSLT